MGGFGLPPPRLAGSWYRAELRPRGRCPCREFGRCACDGGGWVCCCATAAHRSPVPQQPQAHCPTHQSQLSHLSWKHQYLTPSLLSSAQTRSPCIAAHPLSHPTTEALPHPPTHLSWKHQYLTPSLLSSAQRPQCIPTHPLGPWPHPITQLAIVPFCLPHLAPHPPVMEAPVSDSQLVHQLEKGLHAAVGQHHGIQGGILPGPVLQGTKRGQGHGIQGGI